MSDYFSIRVSMMQARFLRDLLTHGSDVAMERPQALRSAKALHTRHLVDHHPTYGWSLTWSGELLANLIDAAGNTRAERKVTA